MFFELDPIEIPCACLVWRVDPLDHQAFQAATERLFEHQLQALGIVDDLAALGLQHAVALDRRNERLDALGERPVRQRLAVAVHDVEHHRLDRQLGLQLADAVLPAAARRLLERQKLVRKGIERQRFGIEDGGLGLHLFEHAVDQLREHARHRLQAAREQAHLLTFWPAPVEVELNTHPVELELRVGFAAELVLKSPFVLEHDRQCRSGFLVGGDRREDRIA